MINLYLGKRTQCEQKIIKNIFNLLGNKFNNWRLVWLIITDVQCITLNGTEDVLTIYLQWSFVHYLSYGASHGGNPLAECSEFNSSASMIFL